MVQITQVCGRSFNQKANKQRHLLTHNKLKDYRCNDCGKLFSQPQTLKAHLVIHAEKKPYSCSNCGMLQLLFIYSIIFLSVPLYSLIPPLGFAVFLFPLALSFTTFLFIIIIIFLYNSFFPFVLYYSSHPVLFTNQTEKTLPQSPRSNVLRQKKMSKRPCRLSSICCALIMFVGE